MRGHIG
jgi:hypothetical protein